MSDHVLKFWTDQASGWSPSNRNPLVGWYDDHVKDQNEELLFRQLPEDSKHMIALEYGCGPGRNMNKFHHKFARIDGVDIVQDILDKLKENLVDTVPAPRLFLNDGHSLKGIESNYYDMVFSIICMQHISSRSWRLEIYDEVYRVLKDDGIFSFQMGFGSGHPISEDYFHEYDGGEVTHKDVRVEDFEVLKKDLTDAGFTDIDHVITDPCKDQHPKWIWVSCRKGKK